MKSLRKSLRLYLPFSRSSIQMLLSYRLNFFMFVLGDILKVFVAYYLWKAVFSNSAQGSLSGFSVNDMIVYIFISSITAWSIGWDTDRTVGMEVRDGSIAMNLIKPINYRVRLLFNAIGGVAYQFMFISLPIWIGLVIIRYFSVGELPPDIFTIFAYLTSLTLAFIITFLFNFCFGLLSFYVTNLWGIRHIKFAIISFFSGELIPIVFFPLWLQKGLSFVPFGSMNYTPVMIYLKRLTGGALVQAIGTQIIWVLILYFLSQILWNKSIKHLTILGG